MSDRTNPPQVRVRFPTLELFSALHGNALSLGGRPLFHEERRDAEFVFEHSIDLDKVRVVHAVVANAPTTLGNFIRIPMDGSIDRQTLIHELAHVWQYQTKGTQYISDSLWHQVGAAIGSGSRNAAYDVTEADLRARSIHDLPAEKQAVVIETFFADARARTDANYRRFIQEVRRASPLPESLILEEAAFGPGGGRRDLFEDPSRPGGSAPGTVPILRIEF
ncbi:MAG TPA: hypothetical protein VE262_04785 [Blastocatellia bacterium]|nr:hypothetical protein [Blastocatellia bacterium]